MRELRNAIERAMILEESSLITPPSLPIAISRPESATVRGGSAGNRRFRLTVFRWKTTSATCWRRALEKTNGNQTQAARLLRITRDTLRYKMKKFNLK